MAETVGRVEIIADVDGRDLDRQVRQLGNKVGQSLGKSMSKGASKELSKLGDELEADMKKHGEFAGISFTNSMQRILKSRLSGLSDEVAEAFSGKDTLRKFVDELGGVEDGSKAVRAKLIEMNEAGLLSDKMFYRLNGTLGQSVGVWRDNERELQRNAEEFDNLSAAVDRMIFSQREVELGANLDALAFKREQEALDELAKSTSDVDTEVVKATDNQRKLRAEVDKTRDSVDKQGRSWRDLPHGFRQVLTYTALFAAMGEEIAVLGSAAGSGLATLGGAFGALGVGVGTTIAAFQDLTGEISELPEAVQPAAEAFQSIGDAFGAMQDRIQIAALDEAAGAFDTIRQTVEGLIPSFEIMGEAVGRVLDTFASSLAPGTAAFANLSLLIEASAPAFESLSNAAMLFGQGLGEIFVVAIPYVQYFADKLAELAGQFLEWTQSIEGQQALNEWFMNGQEIMGALLPLIGALADALNALVTPETVAMTIEFLRILTDFTPILGEILGVIGDLNLLNIFAQILLTIGEALAPIIPQLSETATLIGSILMESILALAPVLGELALALAPVLQAVVQLAGDLLIQLMPVILELTPLFMPLSEAIISIITAITPLIPLIAEWATTIITGLMPVILPLIQAVIDLFVGITPLMPAIITLIQLALFPLDAIFRVILPIVGKLIELVGALVSPFRDLISPIVESTDAFGGLDGMMSDFKDMLFGWVDDVIGGLDNVIGMINDVISTFQEMFGIASRDVPSPRSGGGGGGGGMASGGIVTYGARRLIGEDGPEAVVPLNRALSQVDPSVRALSAFAQGLTGTNGGNGKIVNVEAGAIVVQTVAPPLLVADAVLDRFVAAAAQ